MGQQVQNSGRRIDRAVHHGSYERLLDDVLRLAPIPGQCVHAQHQPGMGGPEEVIQLLSYGQLSVSHIAAPG
ncbi:hypothetical protein GCM10009765_08190 [Fodinicola feengrottensis]|uniref:Uncharacterized protein n=1 Tax=Fodinicola feengrottensis TaxID=435914 RepID=A0ABP4RUR3_9ACTN